MIVQDKMLIVDSGKAKSIGSYFASICLNENNIYSEIEYIRSQPTEACFLNLFCCLLL